MKGLILKDFFNTKNYMKQYMFITGVFMVFGILMKYPGYAGFMLIVAAISMIFSGFTSDEYYHWNTFALALPLKKRDIVRGKFLFMFILFLMVAVLAAVLTGISALILKVPLAENLVTSMVSCLSIPLVGGISLAVIIKFGAEKGRIIFIAICLFPVALSFLVKQLLPSESVSGIMNFFDTLPNLEVLLACGMIGIVVLVNLVAYFIAVRTFEKKEF